MKQSDAIMLATAREALASGEAERIREDADLSRSEVGAVCGVDQSTIYRWERGLRVPRGVPALRFAHLLSALRDAQPQTSGVA